MWRSARNVTRGRLVVESFISWCWRFQFTTRNFQHILIARSLRHIQVHHLFVLFQFSNRPSDCSTSCNCNGNDSLVEVLGKVCFTFNLTRIGVGFSLHFSVLKTWKVHPSSRPTNSKFKWLLSLFNLLLMRVPDQEECINWACDWKSCRWDGKFRKIQVFRVRQKSEKIPRTAFIQTISTFHWQISFRVLGLKS